MNKLKKVISEILGIKPDDITDDLSPDTAKSWDSMNALILVAALESTFHIRFTSAEVTGIKSVREIKEALKKRGVQELNAD